MTRACRARRPLPHTRSPHHFAQYLTSCCRLLESPAKDYGTKESCRGIAGLAKIGWDMMRDEGIGRRSERTNCKLYLKQEH